MPAHNYATVGAPDQYATVGRVAAASGNVYATVGASDAPEFESVRMENNYASVGGTRNTQEYDRIDQV